MSLGQPQRTGPLWANSGVFVILSLAEEEWMTLIMDGLGKLGKEERHQLEAFYVQADSQW